MDKLKAIYQGHLYKVTMGCDFSFWRKLDKSECRKSLNLPAEKLIFISASRIAEVKQLDRLIEVLMNMDSKYDFLYIIAGTGLEYNLKYFMQKAEPPGQKRKDSFCRIPKGRVFIKVIKRRRFIYVNVQLRRRSGFNMEAFACELPVFSPKPQHRRINEEHNAGCLVGQKITKNGRETIPNP
jgi:glycosyltransferase involved in cell wall biosynthesis